MKKLFLILALLAVCISSRAQYVTGNLLITNTPVTGNTLVVDGQVFTWTNGNPGSAFFVLITNTLPGDGTNLFNVVGLQLPFVGVQTIQTNATNLIFNGNGLTASFTPPTSPTWCSLTFTTNNLGGATNVVTPINVLSAPARTNVESSLVNDLNTYSTNALSGGATITSNLFSLTNNNQPVTGSNNFQNASNQFNGGYFTNPILTNGQNFGNPFRSPGTGTGSEQFGLGAIASASFAIAYGDSALASATASVAFGDNSQATNIDATAIGTGAFAYGLTSTAVGDVAGASSDYSTALGSQTQAFGTNSTAVGYNATALSNNSTALGILALASQYDATAIGHNSSTTQTNQIMLGVAGGSVDVPGVLNLEVGVSNLYTLTTSTNILNGVVRFPRRTISSVANGNNANVLLGTNVYVVFTGPNAAWTNCGFTAGVDGEFHICRNGSSVAVVLANESGVDPTVANRIDTGTGAALTVTNTFQVIYDGTLSRWEVIGATQ